MVTGNPQFQIYAFVLDPYPNPSGTSVTGNPKCQIYASVSDPHPNPPRPCQKYMWRKTKFRQVPSWKLYVGIIKKMRCGDGFSENIFFHITKIWKYMSSIAGVVGDGCCGSCAASNLSKAIAFDKWIQYLMKSFEIVIVLIKWIMFSQLLMKSNMYTIFHLLLLL